MELAEAVRWYEDRRPGWGGRLFDAVTHTLGLIEAHPEIGSRDPVDCSRVSWACAASRTWSCIATEVTICTLSPSLIRADDPATGRIALDRIRLARQYDFGSSARLTPDSVAG